MLAVAILGIFLDSELKVYAFEMKIKRTVFFLCYIHANVSSLLIVNCQNSLQRQFIHYMEKNCFGYSAKKVILSELFL